jgi:HPt (histidine-containing phosphotransfer) domain-containing protein
MKILIVDPNPAPMQAALVALGHAVKSADAAIPALALWMRESFDVIAVNMRDREVAGFKLIPALRKKAAETGGQRARIVAVCESDAERARCLESGADAVVAGSVSPAELARVIVGAGKFDKPETPQADEPPTPINKDAALRLMDGDEDLFLEVARMFRADARRYRDLLQTALNAGDAADAEKYAHTLKGASANICAAPFKDAAAAVELAARKGDMALAKALFEKLECEYQRLADCLARIVPS